jgi:hypothetical protein
VTTDAEPTAPYKTSIVFSLKQGPGQLFKALSVFALRDIDMTKIESRPMRSNPILTVETPAAGEGSLPAGAQRFNYLFYVDFVGTLAEPRCQNALRHLQVRCAQRGRAPASAAARGPAAVLATQLAPGRAWTAPRRPQRPPARRAAPSPPPPPSRPVSHAVGERALPAGAGQLPDGPGAGGGGLGPAL